MRDYRFNAHKVKVDNPIIARELKSVTVTHDWIYNIDLNTKFDEFIVTETHFC